MWRCQPRHVEGIRIMERPLGLLRGGGAILVEPVASRGSGRVMLAGGW